MMQRIALFLSVLMISATAFAMQPGEALKDPALEARARALTKELRCLVCQGEAIDESSADLARDLRRMVRERVAAGDTDEMVLTLLRNRYGDYILFRPPVARRTLLLWLTPGLLMLTGLGVVWGLLRRRKKA